VHVMVEAAASQEDADSGDHNGRDSRAGRESSEPRGDSREEPRSDGEAAEPETSWGQRRPRTEHDVDPDDGGLSARSLRREGRRWGSRSHEARGHAGDAARRVGEAAEPGTSWGQGRTPTDEELGPGGGGPRARSLPREGRR